MTAWQYQPGGCLFLCFCVLISNNKNNKKQSSFSYLTTFNYSKFCPYVLLSKNLTQMISM